MNIGDIVKVKGVSQKGKNRVKEHGEEWEVFGFNEFMKRIGLKSVKTKYRRWVDTIEKDEDFEIIKE
jgi:hypothetical protein